MQCINDLVYANFVFECICLAYCVIYYVVNSVVCVV